MKLKTIILTFILAIGFNGIFASDDVNVNRHALNSFEKEFEGAENISWATTGPLTKVTFTLNLEVLYAYYSESGDRVAVGRNIQLSHLPINLMSGIKTSYKEFWITDVFELSKADEEAYYITIENADYKTILKSTNSRDWMIYKTTSKE